ncbi:MAG: type II secretion system protein GspM [Phenylobacterium sp.]|uniref:type II secretion system protein GspM n=1 Tax=Phenylobacterium sp. TaxID=1871053 RepID=UPI00271834B4|nr:type II secretion system protein GspM [Phenylobacterium sp.]MDO8900113.1 type II secretion system protein GspM [Phenylobacterium sp.]
MMDWWTTRSRREQMLLGALGGLLLLFVFWFGLAAPLRGASKDAQSHLARALADEAVVDAAAAEIARLGEAAAPRGRGAPVERLVAQTAEAAGLEIIRIEAGEGGTVQAVVMGPSTAVLPWIAQLQAEHAIAARHLTLLKGEVGQLDVDATFAGVAP